MKTKAVRIYGKNDLRLEEFDLPPMQDDEILAHVISDSLCLSSYKAAIQGEEHQRVLDNVRENPTIIGHEFCGEIIKVGKKWQQEFHPGEKFAIQPALNYQGTLDAPGYSFAYIGGLNCVVDTTLNLPKIPGGKKLIYTNIKMDLIALADIQQKAKDDPLMRELAKILSRTNGLWSAEAEKYLLTQAQPI